jgi:hypothetical protein
VVHRLYDRSIGDKDVEPGRFISLSAAVRELALEGYRKQTRPAQDPFVTRRSPPPVPVVGGNPGAMAMAATERADCEVSRDPERGWRVARFDHDRGGVERPWSDRQPEERAGDEPGPRRSPEMRFGSTWRRPHQQDGNYKDQSKSFHLGTS